MKLAGFLVGAAVAAIAVWLFYAMTTVTDDDRLTAVLRDHCLPYVRAASTPFEGMGRAPGVYDEVNLRDDVQDGGAAILYDNRFVAQWGVIPADADVPGVRLCTVAPSYANDASTQFDVEAEEFIRRYTDVISPDGVLSPDIDTLTEGPRTVGWYQADVPLGEGLRVVMVAAPGSVSTVLVVDNLQ